MTWQALPDRFSVCKAAGDCAGPAALYREADAAVTEVRRALTRVRALFSVVQQGLLGSVKNPSAARTETQNHYRRGELQAVTSEHEWLWITTLDVRALPATVVRQLGHARWKQENMARMI